MMNDKRRLEAKCRLFISLVLHTLQASDSPLTDPTFKRGFKGNRLNPCGKMSHNADEKEANDKLTIEQMLTWLNST